MKQRREGEGKKRDLLCFSTVQTFEDNGAISSQEQGTSGARVEECTRVKNEKLDSFFFFFNDKVSLEIFYSMLLVDRYPNPCLSASRTSPDDTPRHFPLRFLISRICRAVPSPLNFRNDRSFVNLFASRSTNTTANRFSFSRDEPPCC